MTEVSDPDEWAESHHGHQDQFDHQRMLAKGQSGETSKSS